MSKKSFLLDVVLDQHKDYRGKLVLIPFGKQDCTVFRKVISTENVSWEYRKKLHRGGRAPLGG